ncbi:hypothetical protein NMY22_g18228 [Coprinellus aureogranulatus]|nr:hypothetical protein NMY22_g18228 [Coprinellus aureogranulatus]
MSLLEGARKDLFFSELSPEDLHQLGEVDPLMYLANWKPKERTFDTPAAEIKWRTDKLLEDLDGFSSVKPEWKPPKLDEFRRRVQRVIADARKGNGSDLGKVLARVRRLGDEMKDIQQAHKGRIWDLLEEMDRGIQEDPDYLDKIGVPMWPDDDEEDEADFNEDEEDIESSDDEDTEAAGVEQGDRPGKPQQEKSF